MGESDVLTLGGRSLAEVESLLHGVLEGDGDVGAAASGVRLAVAGDGPTVRPWLRTAARGGLEVVTAARGGLEVVTAAASVTREDVVGMGADAWIVDAAAAGLAAAVRRWSGRPTLSAGGREEDPVGALSVAAALLRHAGSLGACRLVVLGDPDASAAAVEVSRVIREAGGRVVFGCPSTAVRAGIPLNEEVVVDLDGVLPQVSAVLIAPVASDRAQQIAPSAADLRMLWGLTSARMDLLTPSVLVLRLPGEDVVVAPEAAATVGARVTPLDELQERARVRWLQAVAATGPSDETVEAS